MAISGQQDATNAPRASRPILGEITGTDGLIATRPGLTARSGFLCDLTGMEPTWARRGPGGNKWEYS